MAGLEQVNLLVGMNNSGKTAFLEAVELVAAGGSRFEQLWKTLARRGEWFPDEHDKPARAAELDVSQLFFGRSISTGSFFEIEADIEAYEEVGAKLVVARIEAAESSKEPLFYEEEIRGLPLEMVIESADLGERVAIPLTSRGGLRKRTVLGSDQRIMMNEEGPSVTFMTTDSLTAATAAEYWKAIVLTDEEQLVVDALKILDDRIMRLAFVGSSRYDRGNKGGILVKYKGAARPVPIGSLGEGMWRLFSIAVALIRAREGVLLVDEIDTGLHYTALEAMWRMVLRASQRMNVQVFATTHSSDCINSLATSCQSPEGARVSLQRLAQGGQMAVAYSMDEIWAAAQHGIETR